MKNAAIALSVKVAELVNEGYFSHAIAQFIDKKLHCYVCGDDFLLDELSFEKHKDWKERKRLYRSLNEQAIVYYCPYCYEVWCGEPRYEWMYRLPSERAALRRRSDPYPSLDAEEWGYFKISSKNLRVEL